MLGKMMKQIGLAGQSFEDMVNKEMTNGLTRLYFTMRPLPVEDKKDLLDRMDEYVRLSRLPKAVKTQEFDELETTLKFDIYRIVEGDFYEEIKSSLTIPTEALETYKSLSDKKRELFRKNVITVPHKKRGISSISKQNMRV